MATKCGYGKVPDKIEGGDTPIQQHLHPDDRQRVLVVFFKLAQDGSFGCAPGRDPNAGNVSSSRSSIKIGKHCQLLTRLTQ
jgi:hypothetical protein